MFDKKIICYNARAMTGEPKSEVVEQARKDKEFLEKCGFVVLCPVFKEGIRKGKGTILSSKEQMQTFWPADVDMIRKAHVLFNLSPHKASLGVIREHGKARYYHWKKVISVFPEGKLPPDGAVPYFEDDFVTDSLTLAVGEALRTHGTYLKRLQWRLKLLNQHMLHAMWDQVKELFR